MLLIVAHLVNRGNSVFCFYLRHCSLFYDFYQTIKGATYRMLFYSAGTSCSIWPTFNGEYCVSVFLRKQCHQYLVEAMVNIFLFS